MVSPDDDRPRRANEQATIFLIYEWSETLLFFRLFFQGTMGGDFLFAVFFFGFVFLSWASLASFVGLAVFIFAEDGLPRTSAFFSTAMVILMPTAAFLADQDSIEWMNQLAFETSNQDHIFSLGQFILNSSFFVGISTCLFGSKYLPVYLKSPSRRICLWALGMSTLWTLIGPLGLFISILWVSMDDLIFSRIIFIALFASTSALVFRLLASLKDRHEKSFIPRSLDKRGMCD